MSSIQAHLPSASQGYLPYWMIFVSSLAVFNSVQNFVTTSLTRRIYARSPACGLSGPSTCPIPRRFTAPDLTLLSCLSVTPLQARTFAAWTLASAAIRIYAAYNISLKPMYDLALISYVLALGHFGLEWLVFRTAALGGGLISPLVVASTSLIWMTRQYDHYVS
ncbi:BZ3500_MvSof-1268-A1-R1_Chr9g10701 [Microbotryum saponariae]|uniref:BZ3500_MvSof-1268-A1-R1_Chr9g10701 protein n=1 Tax=Microbotryum saponariae TaxID=289078 RepID=A0A2X0KBA0_9BASI|nr:BZ3501_MvSof-1269-A2-R1_Chr9g10449 [Microbotryum saponariae]SDA00548.1 BZ3500_MvSof-1268-A1-R1_Chr9g10701 [Microbotryum saponariae]